MRTKTITEYREEIDESLAIIKHEIESMVSFPPGWQSLGTQIAKLLYGGQGGPLICRVISEPHFHPLEKPRFKSELAEDRVKYHLRMVWTVRFDSGSMTFDCFDMAQSPIPLERWLDQVIIEIDSEPLSIYDFITIPRNKEIAHSGTRINKLLRAIKGGMTAVIGEDSVAPLPLGFSIIGSYIYSRINVLLDELEGP